MKTNLLDKLIVFLEKSIPILAGAYWTFLCVIFNIPQFLAYLWIVLNQSPFLLVKLPAYYLLIFHIYLLFRIEYKYKENQKNIRLSWTRPTTFSELLDDFHEEVFTSMTKFYEFFVAVVNFIEYQLFRSKYSYYYKINNLLAFLFKTYKNLTLFYSLFLLKIVPLVLFLMVITYDVWISKKLYYTFFCVPLIFISCLEVFIIFIMKHFCKNHLKFQEHYFFVKQVELFYKNYNHWKYAEMFYLNISFIFAAWRLLLLLNVFTTKIT